MASLPNIPYSSGGLAYALTKRLVQPRSGLEIFQPSFLVQEKKMNTQTLRRILQVAVPLAVDLALFVLEEVQRQQGKSVKPLIAIGKKSVSR